MNWTVLEIRQDGNVARELDIDGVGQWERDHLYRSALRLGYENPAFNFRYREEVR